jgi:hypothetical protein
LSLFGNPIQTTLNIKNLKPLPHQAFSNLLSTDAQAKPVSRWNWMPKHSRTNFYVHQKLDEGHSPEMDSILSQIESQGIGFKSSSPGESLKTSTINQAADQKNEWDAHVKKLQAEIKNS